MEPDPRFPNRPTHHDFDILSKLAIAQDENVEPGVPVPLEETTEGIVDYKSLLYLAENRAAALSGDRKLVAAGMAGIIDGFLLGYKFARQSLIQAQDELTAPDGSRRTEE